MGKLAKFGIFVLGIISMVLVMIFGIEIPLPVHP